MKNRIVVLMLSISSCSFAADDSVMYVQPLGNDVATLARTTQRGCVSPLAEPKDKALSAYEVVMIDSKLVGNGYCKWVDEDRFGIENSSLLAPPSLKAIREFPVSLAAGAHQVEVLAEYQLSLDRVFRAVVPLSVTVKPNVAYRAVGKIEGKNMVAWIEDSDGNAVSEKAAVAWSVGPQYFDNSGTMVGVGLAVGVPLMMKR